MATRLGGRLRLISHRFVSGVKIASHVFDTTTAVASLALIIALVLRIGFEHDRGELSLIDSLIRICQGLFIANVVFRILFGNVCAHPRRHGGIRIVIDIAVLLTAIPWIYPHPLHPWIPWLESVAYSKIVIYGILLAYALVELSLVVMRIPGRRTNPSLLLASSFLIMILVGTLLLMLPKSTYSGITLIDSFFISTSAVCITGLTPVDVATTFTPLGLLILSLLIEFGALGLLTFTSFFALFYSGNSSIYSQLVMRDAVYSKSMSRLWPTMIYILGFTVTIQVAGAVALYFTLPTGLAMSPSDKAVTALFNSMSAFCNAGFSNIPRGYSNAAMMREGSQAVYWVTSIIVVGGAIGFPLLVNLKEAIAGFFRRRRNPHLFDTNTKIVATAFGIIFLLGAVSFFVLEYDNTLRGMTLWEKISQSVFNAVTPRSAGFASVDPSRFLNITLLLVIFQMWIGGAAQSTAGGIKVNCFAAVTLNLRAIVTGRPQVTAFRRTISRQSIARANAVIVTSIVAYLLFSCMMLMFEPHLPVRSILFETLSALFTIGSSLGVTSSLGIGAKITLSLAMFLGRVGIISLLTGVGTRRHSTAAVSYPVDNIIIN